MGLTIFDNTGVGLSIFGGVLSGIYYFKPQTVSVSHIFLAVITFILGEGMALLIPRKGAIGRFLNPHPFNSKEHLAAVLMANSASISALGIEIISAERLFYDKTMRAGVAVFMLFSSQFLGYGMTGLMRKSLVFPKSMLWPSDIPVASMIENLHKRIPENRKPLRVFYYTFLAIFCWEIMPEWIMPLLTGVSIFCLANQHSKVFTYVFGGSSGNEGLGLFSICFDWQYISGGYSPLYYPMDSLISQLLGICLCVVCFCGVYFGNVWGASQFPFLSQELFSANSTSNSNSPNQWLLWNQTLAIGSNNMINKAVLPEIGLPNLATTYALNMLVTNMSTSAAIVHMFLWFPREMMIGFTALDPRRLIPFFRSPIQTVKGMWARSDQHAPDQDFYDPHYKLQLSYKPCPDWWYGVVMACSIVVGLVIIYVANSTLPWWAYLIAVVFGYLSMIILGAMQAVTGVGWLIQPIVQMIGGYIKPGNPVSNMWFSLYGYNALQQGIYMGQDLKLAQYGHLAPRVTFAMQMIGGFIGAIFNYIMANSIITNQFQILVSVEGTNIWSGQQAQTFNTNAITWGGLAHELFSVGSKYQWMTLIFIPGFFVPIPFWLAHKRWPHLGLNNLNMAVIILYISWLCVGINSSILMFYFLGLMAQGYVRRKHPNIFVRYNYLVSAALDGGTSVIVFILSFAVLGAAGPAVQFRKSLLSRPPLHPPTPPPKKNIPEKLLYLVGILATFRSADSCREAIYWGNNANGNFDLCKYEG